MKLSKILSQVKTSFNSVGNIEDIKIYDIAIDSRLVKKDSVFFALSGKTTNGSEFISSAIDKGANLIITESLPLTSYSLPIIICSDPFALLVEFLQIFYAPLPVNIYAITGTNGKTSTAEFTRQICEFLGKKSASIGTLGVICDAEIKESLSGSALTTPDIVSLYKNLHILKKFGVDDVAIEVSSIGLEQKRIAGLEIAVGAFTNFTQDHLDYHKSMEEYFRCKMILFENVLLQSSSAVVNADLKESEEIRKICQNKNHHFIDYGFKARELAIKKIEPHDGGQKIFFEYRSNQYVFDLEVSGDFQAFNALCALGNILAKNDLDQSNLEKLLTNFPRLRSAAGRMEKVATLANGAQIFIDFAHTPDALINVLQLGRKVTKSRLLVLFGCGGNRDAKKRPQMGKIASDLADLVIVTDDNPRLEKAEEIRREILQACDLKKTIEINDRKVAIKEAISMLQSCDILILAGKGHEKYQIIGDQKFTFDEEEIVKNVIRKPS
jgi:UDP-N-acetylmuramoyl-L-alanyl-D-glutamate--2,6-diaminopimelate ligase